MSYLDYEGLQVLKEELLDTTLTSNKKAAPADLVGALNGYTEKSILTKELLIGKATFEQGTGTNTRTVYVDRNTFGTIGNSAKTGSTFQTYLVSGTPRYLGGTTSNAEAQLTADDFLPLYLPSKYALWAYLNYKSTDLRNVSRAAGYLFVWTRNPDTGVISRAQLGSASISNKPVYITNSSCITAVIPQIIENQNIAIGYQAKYPSTTEEFSVVFCAENTASSSSSSTGTWRKCIGDVLPSFVANKNYAVNDIVLIGNNLYIITQAIASGETIIPDTNATYTTLGSLITSILNS